MNRKVVLFDTETTGKELDDRIIQLGVLVADSSDIYQYTHHEDFCQAVVPINVEAMEIHHITPEMLYGMDSIEKTYSFNLLHSSNSTENYFVAHNINFDLNMLTKENFVCCAKVIDTHRCAKHLLKQFKTHRLQYLRYALELYKQDDIYPSDDIMAHSALGDVFTMHQLLNHLLDVLKRDEPNKDPFEYLAELTKQPVLIDEFPFGKHKDIELHLIPTDYIEWALRTLTDLGDDLTFSLKQTLKNRGVK